MLVEPRMIYNYVENAMEIWNLCVYFILLFKELNSLVITDLMLHACHDLFAEFVLIPLSHHLREPALLFRFLLFLCYVDSQVTGFNQLVLNNENIAYI